MLKFLALLLRRVRPARTRVCSVHKFCCPAGPCSGCVCTLVIKLACNSKETNTPNRFPCAWSVPKESSSSQHCCHRRTLATATAQPTNKVAPVLKSLIQHYPSSSGFLVNFYKRASFQNFLHETLFCRPIADFRSALQLPGAVRVRHLSKTLWQTFVRFVSQKQ